MAVTSTEPAASGPTPTCPNYVDVVETGPLPADMPEDGPIPQAQARLQGDLDAAIAYGAAHPDQFASIRFENAPRVRIVVGFTGDIDAHCAALRALFQYPDEFEIIHQTRTSSDLERIQGEIVALVGQKMRSVGIGAGTIDVGLRADAEPLAAKILADYGDVATITLGLQPYPKGRAPVVDCAQRFGLFRMGPPYTATVRLAAPSVPSGEDFTATATVTNTSDSPVEFESGEPAVALIYRSGTDQLVGVYDGGIGGTGLGDTLAPGASIDIDVVGGTASCLADLGFALPPGDYDVRAAIDQYERAANGDTITRYLLSAPTTLTVTP